MDKFTSLLATEGQIAVIYKDLSNVESSVTMDNIEDCYQLFIVLINKLLELLDQEEELLKSLSNEEIDLINMLLENGTIISNDDQDLFSKSIKDRLDFRINGNNPKLDNNRFSNIHSYILDDFDNYYLSFIEEWIHNEKNKLTKEYLIAKKYQYIFLLSRRLEKRKIKESFGTEESIYTESYMLSQLSKLTVDEYIKYRNRIALSKVTMSINQMTALLNKYNHNEDNDEQFKIVYKLFAYSLRSALILLSNDIKDEIINNIREEDDSFEEEISNIFEEDFVDIIKKDTERHKLLSLNI